MMSKKYCQTVNRFIIDSNLCSGMISNLDLKGRDKKALFSLGLRHE